MEWRSSSNESYWYLVDADAPPLLPNIHARIHKEFVLDGTVHYRLTYEMPNSATRDIRQATHFFSNLEEAKAVGLFNIRFNYSQGADSWT